MASKQKAVSGIYTITSPSGKQYVGSSISIKRRWVTHRNLLRRGIHHCTGLQHAWNKYGEEGLVFEQIIICEPKNLTMFEQRSMDVLRPAYNILKYARSALGSKHSEETKAKIGASRLGKPRPPSVIASLVAANTGRIMLPEQKLAISKANLGQKRTELQIGNMKKAQANNPGPSEEARELCRIANLGRKHTPEHIEKNRLGQIGKIRTPETLQRMSDSARAFCEQNKELVAERVRAVHLGKKRSAETRAKISEKMKLISERKKAANG